MNTNKNILYYQIYTYSKKSLFLFYILTLYYLNIGLSYTQISILSVLGTLTTLLSEVPTGIISDRWSYKKSLQVAAFFKLLSTVFLLFPQFFFLCISSVLWGIADSCDSGADQALLYNSFTNKDEYDHFLSKVYSRGYLASAFATLSATTLFSWNIYLPVILSCLLIFSSLLSISMFKESYSQKQSTVSFGDFNKQVLSHLVHRPELLNLLLLMTFCTLIIMNINSYCQPLLLEKGINLKLLGFLMLLYNLLMSFGSHMSKKFHTNYISYYIIFLLCICSALIGYSNLYIGIILFAVSRFLNGMIWPLLTTASNSLIPSSIRASVLSYQSMATNILSMILSPALGILLDTMGLNLFYIIIGILFLLLTFTLFLLRIIIKTK